MDAIEFVKQLRRMDKNVIRKYSVFDDSPEDIVSEVEEWAKMNPVKTRQSVFLEQWPEAKRADNILAVCPKVLDMSLPCWIYSSANVGCEECRREFWMQEVE
nr:MAG TPA: hypothetical protein [Caudoviricetes sp.]